MKRVMIAIAVLVFSMVATAHAQQPAAPADPHHPPAVAPAQPATPPGEKLATPPGEKPNGAMPMMSMCREMMSGQGTMGGMMGGAPADPKMMAAMMEMRGEMMKAMDDVMMKHARKMHGMPPAPK